MNAHADGVIQVTDPGQALLQENLRAAVAEVVVLNIPVTKLHSRTAGHTAGWPVSVPASSHACIMRTAGQR